MPKESTIVTSILTYINGLKGGVAEKTQGTARSSGKADINACYQGRSIRIEVKTPDDGNTASKKQSVNLQRWRAAGALAFVAYSVKDVIEAFKREFNV